MKRFITLFFSLLTLTTSAQVLGNYMPITLGVGRDTSVNPVSVPINTVKIAVFASGNFSGILTAIASTGRVSITDAKPVGNYTITVKAFSSSGTSTIKTFTLIVNNTECNDGRFNGNTNYPIIRPNLTGIAIGDFNGDNKQDLLAAHIGYNSVSIRLGNGAGGFAGSTEEPVSSHPYALAVGDFDRDGKQDFLVSNEGADLVAVRLGDGAGAFISMSNVHVGTSPKIVAIGDFNQDGKQDFAVTNFLSNTVSICIGDGAGNFALTANVSVGSYPEFVTVSDFNNDGKQDLAVTNSGSQSVSIRLGNGSGGFSAATDVPVGYNPYTVVSGDFNSDGNQDLAVANYSSNTVSIRLGNGLGTFVGTTDFPISGGPYSIALGNFNGDSHLDLAITNYFTNKVSIRLGDGIGGFFGNTQVAVGSYPVCVVAGDFNGDRRQDIAVANYNDHSISVRLGMNGIPSPSPVSSNSPVCEGRPIHFYSTGGSSFSWSGPNGFTSTIQNPDIPVAASTNMGIYSLTLRDHNNCSATLTTLVRVNPPPVVTFNLGQDSLCTFDPSLLLSGGQPAGGTYSGPGVVSGNLFDPSVTGQGNYYLMYTYTDTNDCSNSEIDKMNVILCTGLVDPDIGNQVHVYPNPAKENFTIELKSLSGSMEVQLYTPDGKLVNSWIVTGNSDYTYSTHGLSRGVYFLRCIEPLHSKTIRLQLVD